MEPEKKRITQIHFAKNEKATKKVLKKIYKKCVLLNCTI